MKAENQRIQWNVKYLAHNESKYSMSHIVTAHHGAAEGHKEVKQLDKKVINEDAEFKIESEEYLRGDNRKGTLEVWLGRDKTVKSENSGTQGILREQSKIKASERI